MARTVSIGAQGFADIRERGAFLVDKTSFISEWWSSLDAVTLICRPRRFGKTLNLDMVDRFLSTRYAGRADLFEGLDVWSDEGMRAEQGAWPVIFLSFADVKAESYEIMRRLVVSLISNAYEASGLSTGDLNEVDGNLFRRTLEGHLDDAELALSLRNLCKMLTYASGRRVVILLDEYDTPLQEAWINGYWDKASALIRGLLNSTFKTNPHLERGLMTGITRIAHESIFSDLNNLNVVTTTSDEYATSFGFTQDEVDAALEEFGLADTRDEVRAWYDGFTFGGRSDIYNPWSITNYLDKRRFAPYWANTSGNGLVSSLVGASDADFKSDFETLLSGGEITERVDEQIAFPDLDYDPSAVWSLLTSSGYLRVASVGLSSEGACRLAITNHETMLAFDGMVRRWFAPTRVAYNGFVRALLSGDLKAMNAYMNDVALDTFSTFDTGRRPSRSEPERFYHGFVLGLLVELRDRYRVLSNRESGYGRYDVMLSPREPRRDPGIVMEFKVFDPDEEATLADTVASALAQIRERRYAAELVALGVPEGDVRAYGLAFEGKRVLVGA